MSRPSKIDQVLKIALESQKILRQHDVKFDRIDQRLGNLEVKSEQADRKFTGIDQRFVKIDERFEKVDQRFEKVFNLIGSMYTEMQAGFAEAKAERIAMKQDFGFRMDDLQEQIDQVRQTQLEDSRALNSVVMDNRNRIAKLEQSAV